MSDTQAHITAELLRHLNLSPRQASVLVEGAGNGASLHVYIYDRQRARALPNNCMWRGHSVSIVYADNPEPQRLRG